jgi:outer membrane lipoprotein LolB
LTDRRPALAGRRAGGALCSRLAGLAAAALLSACATAPPPAPPQAPAAWTSGRLALRVEAQPGQPARQMTASFELQGDAHEGELRLLTPLGTLAARTVWGPGRVELSTPEGARTFDDLDTLSREALGEVLPLRALPDWLAGRPWRAVQSLPRDSGFQQLGWDVDTTGFAEGLLVARREAPPAVLLRVRLER